MCVCDIIVDPVNNSFSVTEEDDSSVHNFFFTSIAESTCESLYPPFQSVTFIMQNSNEFQNDIIAVCCLIPRNFPRNKN